MKNYKTLSGLHKDNHWPEPENPLFSMVGCQRNCPLGEREFTVDAYVIAFKKLKSGTIMYGRTPYDNVNGSMYFMKPRQIIEMRGLEFEEDGFMLFIHEDYLHGHDLHRIIQQYGYFEYEVNEALHLSPKEEGVIRELYQKIVNEYANNQDEYSKEIMLSHVASILMYAQRYYKRQFINRNEVSGRTVSKFNDVLKTYFATGKLEEKGLPTVREIATQLFLSPRYLSDLLQQETGKTAMELIHLSLVQEAKNLLRVGDKTISEVAFQLGFEDASYFSRLFKKQLGVTPQEFRRKF